MQNKKIKNNNKNRIRQRFRELGRKGQKAFIAFITAGYPNLTITRRLALEFARRGVDILELGVPFSDPLADGPTIQAASQRALKNKVNLTQVLKLVVRLRGKIELPIVLLVYYNVILRYGLDNFFKQASSAGVDGVVVPDLPAEEARDLNRQARMFKVAAIFLLAPTSDKKRISAISAQCSGFIYYVSLTGTTGARKKLPSDLIEQVRRIKRCTVKPVCVGFGIARPRQAKLIAQVADGVIVGSAIINVIESNLGRKDLVLKVGRFVQRLRQAI